MGNKLIEVIAAAYKTYNFDSKEVALEAKKISLPWLERPISPINSQPP